MTGNDLRRAFSLANAFKEGDLAVGGTTDDQLRDEARQALRATTAGDIRRTTFIDDGVSDALARSRDRTFDADLDRLTIGRLADTLLAPGGATWAHRHGDALASEVIAAIAKVLTNAELSTVARAIVTPLPGGGVAIGGAAHLGSRIQPNSPGDDDDEILFSILDGLTHGCGDVIVGLNPASDDLDSIVRLEQLLEQVVLRLELPTRFCVLSDIVKQHAARRFTRVDVAFQSLAGSSRALAGMVGMDVDGLAELTRPFDGLYFETGQGSEVTNGAAEGLDMVTLEARTYGLARHLGRRLDRQDTWMIVNDVAGFIGPEVFRTEAQLERACLEDIVMARLHGLTMGLDVCATFHMGIAPAALRRLTQRIAQRAAPAYLMAVAGNADPMLGYLTTSFREHPGLRQATARQMTSPMQERLTTLGILDAAGTPSPGVDAVARLYAAHAGAGGDHRHSTALEDEGRRRLFDLRERGFDLGGISDAAAEARADAIYSHAHRALYAQIDDAVIRDACPRSLRIRTAAADRDTYLARPSAGEQLAPDEARTLAALAQRAPQVQLVVSDGLNADAVNEQLRLLLPAVRYRLTAAGRHVSETDVLIRNGRVRAGYEVGAVVGADVVVHVIGERPGTGLNTLSAYVTYGRSEAGAPRWSRDLDHSATTAICGIHPRGRPPAVAAAEIARTIDRIVEQRRSGVTLRPH